MKKIILSFLLGSMALTGSAQYVSHKPLDNCYAGVQLGGTTPMKGHAFLGSARTLMGFQLGKQFTPIVGLELQTTLGVNTSGVGQRGAQNAIDNIHSSLLGRVNLSNYFYGYNKARTFEMEAVYGFGHNHWYVPSAQGEDREHFTSTAGMNFNYRLGKTKAWGITLRPYFVWDLSANAYHAGHAQFQVTAGVTYYFKGANGKRYITKSRLYDQPEVDALNAKINDLRETVKAKDAELAKKHREVLDLQRKLNDERRLRPAGK
jgi:hypothetical protein